jgi:hypothetical protein
MRLAPAKSTIVTPNDVVMLGAGAVQREAYHTGGNCLSIVRLGLPCMTDSTTCYIEPAI